MPKFVYDEAGQRIKKQDHRNSSLTWYVYDAGGSLMAVYDNNGGAVSLKEQPVYGAGRLGIYFRQNSNYQYALSDHTGSVRAVINRNKLSNGNADVVYYADYYPFGTVLRSGGSEWRYGYQGEYAEKDGETGWNNFQLRNYDAAIGRWLTTDPYGQYWSPYVGMGNNPVLLVDADGGWASGEEPKAKVWDSSNPFYNPLPEVYIGRPFEFKRNLAYSPWMGPGFFNEPPTMNAALVFAGTAALSDGRLPIGEVVGAPAIIGTAIYLTPSMVEKMNKEIAGIEERMPGGMDFSMHQLPQQVGFIQL